MENYRSKKKRRIKRGNFQPDKRRQGHSGLLDNAGKGDKASRHAWQCLYFHYLMQNTIILWVMSTDCHTCWTCTACEFMKDKNKIQNKMQESHGSQTASLGHNWLIWAIISSSEMPSNNLLNYPNDRFRMISTRSPMCSMYWHILWMKVTAMDDTSKLFTSKSEGVGWNLTACSRAEQLALENTWGHNMLTGTSCTSMVA